MPRYRRIRDLREDNDLTQQAVADQLKLHKTTYVRYEQSETDIPFGIAIQIADFYRVSLEYLAGASKCGTSKTYT